jgi:hypothetical protein
VAGSRGGALQQHHRVPTVLDKAPVGAKKVVEQRDDGGERGYGLRPNLMESTIVGVTFHRAFRLEISRASWTLSPSRP